MKELYHVMSALERKCFRGMTILDVVGRGRDGGLHFGKKQYFEFAKTLIMVTLQYCIRSCLFYPKVLKPEGLAPVEHCVCWAGIGFGEGAGIIWKNRRENECFFDPVKT